MANITNITPAQVGVLSVFDKAQLALIKRTVAADCNDSEFDLFITVAAKLKLNPLKKQIYAFVFNKDKPARRNMVLVTAISGLRTIAERTGNYRPDDALPVYEYDEALKNPEKNPLGLVSCTVKVWKHSHGQWFATPHQVFWDAYAPLVEDGTWEDKGETWENGNAKKTFVKNGKVTLDSGKPRWRTDPRGMLAKCAEAGALRKAWPDEMAQLYEESEMDRGNFVELSPSEYAEQQAVENRLERIQGGQNSILFEFPPDALAPLPIGQIVDKALAYFRSQENAPDAIEYWQERNRHGLQEFWARQPGDALALKKEMEKLISEGRKPKT